MDVEGVHSTAQHNTHGNLLFSIIISLDIALH